MIELEVVGKHALLFDDDSSSAFINSSSALVDWNSLFIDRYDVRHLLSGPIPPRIRRKIPFSGETEIDLERYRDLNDNDFQKQHQEYDVGAQAVELGGFHSVAFSYGNPVDSNDQKNHNDGAGDSGYRPPFPIPDSLLQCLPPTKKVHQIMARTALFVSKNGGQSEIVLRVKQGDNPTFGFLMPDHHLHPYFRYLVDHQDLLMSDMAGKSENNHTEKTSGALSLLGSVYGSGDDEEAPTEDVVELKQKECMKTVGAGVSSFGHSSQETGILAKSHERDEVSSKPSNSEKEKIHVLKKSSLMKFSKAGIPSGRKKESQSTLPSATVNIPPCSVSVNASTAETVILEPPSDVRKLVTRVVEFILKNGPQFEAVLTEQDSKYGRFPFLLPSNQFHSYYTNVLREAQESKLSGKSFSSEKNDRVPSRLEKKLSLGKGSASSSLGPSSGEIPFDSDRKEKFKMVLGKSKKDGDEPPSRIDPPPYGYTIDAAQTAAILQAATRGVKNTHFVPNISLNGDIHNEARVEAAAEAYMTKEQKLKAERLKRAKMFVSMLKTGSAPSKSETTRAFSMEPQLPVASAKESEDILVKKDESERKLSDSEIQERISRRKYRSRPSRSEDGEEKDEVKDEEEKGKNVKHYSKKHQSHRSLRESDKEVEEDQENTYYRHAKRKHRSHRSSHRNDSEEEVDGVEENRVYKHGKRKPRSRDSGEEEEQEEDENDMDHRHGNRKHRTHRSSRETDMEEDEGDRDYRHGKRKHRSYRTSREDEEEEELEDGDKRDRKKGHKKHRSCHSSDEDDGNEKDYKNYRKKHRARHSSDEDDGNGRDYKNYRKKHRSHHSSDDEDDNDNEDNHGKHSKKRHRAHHASRRSKDKYKHKERHTSLRNKSPDDENYSDSSSGKGRSISPSAEDLEEGEIISKVSDQSRGSVGGDASREASIDVSSSQRDDRAPSQPLEASEVPDELRAKIRAMLMSNF